MLFQLHDVSLTLRTKIYDVIEKAWGLKNIFYYIMFVDDYWKIIAKEWFCIKEYVNVIQPLYTFILKVKQTFLDWESMIWKNKILYIKCT